MCVAMGSGRTIDSGLISSIIFVNYLPILLFFIIIPDNSVGLACGGVFLLERTSLHKVCSKNSWADPAYGGYQGQDLRTRWTPLPPSLCRLTEVLP
jgi:hypothetical protein